MVHVDRGSLVTLGVALLCILAIALAAGTIGQILVPEDSVIPGIQDPGGDMTTPTQNQTDQIDGADVIDEGGGLAGGRITMCVRPLTGATGLGMYFGAFLILFYGVVRLTNLSSAMLIGYAVLPFVVLGYFFFTDCPEAGGEAPEERQGESALEWVAGTEVIGPTDISPVIPAILFGIALLGVVLLIYTSTDDELPLEEEDEEVDEQSVEALGWAAGKAADRLEGHHEDVDNEVYRAWQEMTGLLDMKDPETSTPRMFADAAIDVGMKSEYVNDLTRLFEEVRYGHEDPDEREDHAITIFRRIEEEYAPDGRSAAEQTGNQNNEGQ